MKCLYRDCFKSMTMMIKNESDEEQETQSNNDLDRFERRRTHRRPADRTVIVESSIFLNMKRNYQQPSCKKDKAACGYVFCFTVQS